MRPPGRTHPGTASSTQYPFRVAKRISTEAYGALREALAVCTWYKDEFEQLLKTALREHPELLAPLDFTSTKRVVANQLVDVLVQREARYRDVTIRLMIEIAGMTRFPGIERIASETDRQERLADARRAVAALKPFVTGYEGAIAEERRVEEARRESQRKAAEAQSHAAMMLELKGRFLALQSPNTNPQERGYALEKLLAELFSLFDLEPRMAYAIDGEQIDGSFRLDTDDYIVEAKWRSGPSGRDQADVFAAKVRSKGKNAMGLFVSINGFAQTFLDRFASSTPFVTMDGHDLFLILDERIGLDDALRAKRRHANDTGSCSLPLQSFLTSSF